MSYSDVGKRKQLHRVNGKDHSHRSDEPPIEGESPLPCTEGRDVNERAKNDRLAQNGHDGIILVLLVKSVLHLF